MFRLLRRLLSRYLICVGLTAHVAALAGAYWALGYFNVTPRQLVLKGLERAGIEAPWVVSLIAPAPRYAGRKFDGRIRETHPRILLPELAGWRGPGVSPYMARRLALYRRVGIDRPRARAKCGSSDGLVLAACWIMTGRRDAGARGTVKLGRAKARIGARNRPVTIAGFGSPWRFALAYDLLFNHPDFTPEARRAAQSTLRAVLDKMLAALDGADLSLWHGRASVAAEAWLVAVALGRETRDDAALTSRAQGHFLDAMAGLGLTEAWPGGYSYWINNRALMMALGASAYVNGLDGARQSASVKRTITRAAYWSVFATRPDNRIEGLGDEGPRVDLKDETRRFIDVVAQLSGDGVLSAYSRYLERLHGRESYYRRYRWSFALFNDPTVAPARPIDTASLAPLDRVLPRAMVFGEAAFNQVYMRSGWGPDATFVSFRAGGSFSHHGHYDAGHFTVFKGAPLAINSSLYGAMFAENRINYAIRTVAKNTLLILRPGETQRPNRMIPESFAAGGQRLTLPTGSALASVADWRANRQAGLGLDGGRLRAFDTRRGVYSFVSADLTRAYNHPGRDDGGGGGKVRRVVRDLLYLHDDDVVLVRDDVETTDAAYVKKWLLHSVAKPRVAGARVLRGTADDGILESDADLAVIENGGASLVVRRFGPDDAVIRLVGGPGHRFYVETDGDDSVLDGRNMSGGAVAKPWFDGGDWRLEIQPRAARLRDQFLVALAPGIGPARLDAVEKVVLAEGSARALATQGAVVVFTDERATGEIAFAAPGGQRRVYLIGARPGIRVTLTTGGVRRDATAAGFAPVVFDVELTAGEAVRLRLDGAGAS